MNTPNDLKYARTHEWAKIDEDGYVVIGISQRDFLRGAWAHTGSGGSLSRNSSRVSNGRPA